MRTVLLFVALGLCVGCARKGAKPNAPAKDDLTNVKLQQPVPAPNPDKKDNKDVPNWIVQPQDKKDQLPADAPANGGKQPWNVGPPQGGFAAPVPGVQPPAVPGMVPPNPVPANPPPIAVGSGTPVGAANKLVAMADMRDLQIFIHDASLVTGVMPTAADTMKALIAAGSPAAALVKDGAIILTGARQRESVWAFEARAYLNGGLVVSQNGVEALTAAELKARLGN